MLPLTKEELKSYQDAKLCCICGNRILKKLSKSINYWNVKDHCHYTSRYRDAAHSIWNLKFNVPNEIPVAFYDHYDHHFIIKELAGDFVGKFECLGENT